MKTLIIVLIIASLLQTTVIPIDLVLLILICRTYIRSDIRNLYLAFGFGLFTSHLYLNPLGFQSLLYLIFVQATESLSKIRLAGNPLLIIPITFVFISLNQLALSIIGQDLLEFPKIILASFLSLPTLFLIRIWEERFIVRKEIKLKI